VNDGVVSSVANRESRSFERSRFARFAPFGAAGTAALELACGRSGDATTTPMETGGASARGGGAGSALTALGAAFAAAPAYK